MSGRRGRLRVYLGAAPGVGKTFSMLGEAHRRAERGTDIVVGFVETHGRPHTAELLEGLEVIPRRKVSYRGGEFEEMDLDAVLARRPSVALVDEMAHTNVPGSRNDKRWQDIEELLAAGVDVITTVNVQHLESLNDVVEKITGVPQRETVPDAVVRAADQIELEDMTAEALRRRLAHGNVYPPEKIDAALSNYFRAGNLTALRELALLWTADRVDEALQLYREQHDITTTWEARERVVVALTGGPEGETLIRRAARVATRSSGGDLLAVHVARSDGLAGASQGALARQRQLVESLGGSYHQVLGDDVPEALLAFARAENATQLVLGDSRRSLLARAFSRGTASEVIRHSGDIDVHVVTHQHTGLVPALPRGRGSLSRRRRVQGFALAVAAAAADDGAPRASRPGAQPRQRHVALPPRHRGRRDRRRSGARHGRGHPGIAAPELLLHPAAPHAHHPRDQQHRRSPGLHRGGPAGQLRRRHGGATYPPGLPGRRRSPHPRQPGRQRAGRRGGAHLDARAGPGDVRADVGDGAAER